MPELLDGSIFCQKCGMPYLSDGEGHYRHIVDIPRNRLRELLTDQGVAGRVFDWLGTLRLTCPCCGEKENPYKGLPREEVIPYLQTVAGANDLFLTLHDLLSRPLEHPTELRATDAVQEAERLIRGGDNDSAA